MKSDFGYYYPLIGRFSSLKCQKDTYSFLWKSVSYLNLTQAMLNSLRKIRRKENEEITDYDAIRCQVFVNRLITLEAYEQGESTLFQACLSNV